MRSLFMLALVALLAPATALPAAAFPISKCVIEVEGTAYLDGPCNYEEESDGSFQIGVGAPGVASKYFAYLVTGFQGAPAQGYWNSVDAADKAFEDLGVMTQDGACWVNDTARLCAFR